MSLRQNNKTVVNRCSTNSPRTRTHQSIINKICFDIDGVLRDLNGHLTEHYGVPEPQEWGWTYENRNIYDWAKKDHYRILKDAPPTEYLDVVLKYYRQPELWTHQPIDWRPATEQWVRQHIGYDCVIRYLTTKEKRARLDQDINTLLLEDNPNFNTYDRILLIHRPYNKRVNATVRIKNPKQLEKILKQYGKN